MGSVITVTTRLRPGALERMARSRLDRDGVAQFAAETSNGRQRRLLRQVRDSLAADADLDVFYADRTDGTTYCTVYWAGERQAAIWGTPRHLQDEDPDGDYWV